MRGVASCAHSNQQDMVEAIHSLTYFVASAVADKDFSWVHATPEKIHSPVIARLMSVVEVDPAPPATTGTGVGRLPS